MWIKQTILILLVCLPVCFASAKHTDSAAEMLNKRAFSIRTTYPDSARFLAEEALAKATKTNDKFQMAESHKNIGDYFRIKNNLQEALSHYKRALNYAHEARKEELLVKIYNNIGIAFKEKGLYDSSIFYLYKSLDILELKNLESKEAAQTLHNIGVTFYYSQDYALSDTFFKRSLILFEKFNDTNGVGKIYNSYGSLYFALEKYHEALLYYKKYLKSIISNDYYYLGIAYENISTTFEALNILDSAYYYSEKALFYSQKAGDDLGISINYHNMGNILARQKRNTQALYHYKKALHLADSIRAINQKKEFLYSIVLFYEDLKDFENSLYYYKQYTETKDMLLDEEKNKAIADIREKYEALEKEKKLLILSKEHQKAESDKKFYILLSIFSVLVIILGIASAVLYGKKEYNRLASEKNLAISSAIIEGEEKEREKISMELHDDISSSLHAIRMLMAVSKQYFKDNNMELFDRINTILSDTAKRTRQLSHELFSISVRNSGIRTAISDHISQLENTKINFVFHTDIEDERFDKDFELNCFRIIQELIVNTIKYANASQATITVNYREDNKFYISYCDNGMGYNPKEHKGMGMKSIKLRVERYKGIMKDFSSPEKGVHINIILSIP